MRKLMAALLAAAALTTPALGQRGRDRDGDAGMQAAPERTVEQEQRAERPAAQTRTEAPRQQRQDVVRERRDDGQASRTDRQDDRQAFRGERQSNPPVVQADRPVVPADQYQNRAQSRRDPAQPRRDFRQGQMQDRSEWQRNRQDWQQTRSRNNDGWQSGGNRQHRDTSVWNGGRGDNSAWNREWRRDPRYNWQDWRRHNGHAYHTPYYAPRGWNYGYSRFSLGVYLSAPLFAQDYWIDDPYDYRLPPAYGPYRWVRYYDDVLLVDLRNGLVVDVIYDFFD